MDKGIDNIIKSTLTNEVRNISFTENSSDKISERIKEGTGRYKKYSFFPSIFEFKRHIVIAASLFIVCIISMLTFSGNARALAAQAIDTINNIFTVEEKDNQLQVVQKPANECNFSISVVDHTLLSDKEIEEKVGFKVSFNDFKLNNDDVKLAEKLLGVNLSKSLDYNTYESLQNLASKSITDETAFLQLKPYGPSRFTAGIYSLPDKTAVSIYIHRDPEESKELNKLNDKSYTPEVGKKVKIGSLYANWIDSQYPSYPIKTRNGIRSGDMSQKPDIMQSNSLMWEKAGVIYTLSPFKYSNLPLEDSLKIAEAFMNAN